MKPPPFALIAPKYETSARKEAQKQNINIQCTRFKRKNFYEIIINTYFIRDQMQFGLKFFIKL